ncbi:Negative regulator of mitotic exit [Ascosphaera pollenicola]|nr:Negative regulator of mitotic exit [Ascosphaera pollenicola]
MGIFSAAECRVSGGKWKGGRDISGHVFMLVLMSAVLFLEWFGAAEVVVGDLKASDLKAGDEQEKKEKETKKGEEDGKRGEECADKWMRIIVWVMVGLSFWMLLMTAIFFHTWLEKIAGLVIALITVFVVYFLPADVPSLRNIVGIPGF